MPLMPGTQDVSVDTKGGAAAGHPGQRRRRRLSSTGPDGGRSSTGASARPSTRADPPTLFADAPAGEKRAEVRAADDRRLAVDGGRRRQADAASVALTGARIVTMADRRRRRSSTTASIVIRGDRIVAVGRRGEVADPGRRDDRRRDRQDDHPRPGRRPRPRPAGRRRAGAAAELVGDRQPRARHDDDPRPVGARVARSSPPSEMQRAGHDPRPAHLLDRRDRLRRQGGRTSMPRSTASTTRSPTSAG